MPLKSLGKQEIKLASSNEEDLSCWSYVFRSDSKEIGKFLKGLCEAFGFEGVYPLDNEISNIESKPRQALGKEIAEANVELIHGCDYVLANLEPFRGPSADCGTVWECAYAKGLGKMVAGYSKTKSLPYKDKVLNVLPHDGMMVEDFHAWDNIMLVHGIDFMCSDPRVGLQWLREQDKK